MRAKKFERHAFIEARPGIKCAQPELADFGTKSPERHLSSLSMPRSHRAGAEVVSGAPMNAKNELNGIVDLVVPEIHELEEEIDPVPEMIAKQLNEPLFEFRPLTEEEKKEFVDTLDARGKQILAELAGQPENPCNSCCYFLARPSR